LGAPDMDATVDLNRSTSKLLSRATSGATRILMLVMMLMTGKAAFY
jgi:hypothetical protein